MENQGSTDDQSSVEAGDDAGTGDVESTVSVDEVLPIERVERAVSVGSIAVAKTRVGLALCCAAMGLVGLVSIMIVVYFFIAAHSLKPLAQPLTEESLKLYREARGIVVDDILKVSDRILGTVLVPILTLLLGYMFGSREDRSPSGEEG